MPPTGPRGRWRPPTIVLAAVGLAGPILFTLVVLAQGLVHADFDHAALPISALAAWPGGWVQNVNFIVFGLLAIAFAVALHLGLQANRAGAAGPALLVLSGIGLVVAGLFPGRLSDGAFITPVVHIAGGVLTFLGTGLGLVVTSRRMAGDPRWRGLAAYTLASGIAIVVLFVVIAALARWPGMPLHPWFGLLQRVTLAVWFPCTIVLAIRLLWIARADEAAPPSTGTMDGAGT